MSLTSPDFESGAYTNFATPAATTGEEIIKRVVRGIATQALCRLLVQFKISNKSVSRSAGTAGVSPALITRREELLIKYFDKRLSCSGALAGETPAVPV